MGFWALIFLVNLGLIHSFVLENEHERVARDIKDGPTFKVKSLEVKSEIRSRFAVTKISSEVRNLAREAQELFFLAQLPAEAFISNFTMEINGRLEVGEVKGKEEALRDFEKAKSQGKTTGLVAKKARETELFRTSVNVAAGGKVLFTLTYQEVLKRVHGVYKHVLNIVSVEGIEEVSLSISIIERGKIARIHVPRFAEKIGEKTNKELLALPQNQDVDIRTREVDGITFVDISFSPENGDGGQLAVLYDVQRSVDGGEIEVVNGFFVHFFAPESDSAACANNIVFVLDKSGSMSGRKFAQLQEAMATILRQLKEEDNFGMVWFSSGVQVLENTLRPASKGNVDRALAFVERERANGGTNIHAALVEGIKLLESVEGEGTKMVMFLTDGLATAGEIQDNDGIRAAVSARNDRAGVVIHCLAFGDDADFILLRQIASDNQGLARKIFQAADAALQLDGFYSEISCPVFRDVNIKYLNGSVEVGSLVSSRKDPFFYAGSEQVIVGKMVDPDKTQLRGEISATAADGAPTAFRCGNECFFCCRYFCPIWCHRFILPCPTPPKPKPSPPALPADTLGGFIERMWAYMTIKKNLREAELDSSQAKKLRAEAKKLSLKYGFVTELTSLVIVDKATNPEPIREDRPPSGFAFSGTRALSGSKSDSLGIAPVSSFVSGVSGPVLKVATTAAPCKLKLLIIEDNRATSALANSSQALLSLLRAAKVDLTLSFVRIVADGKLQANRRIRDILAEFQANPKSAVVVLNGLETLPADLRRQLDGLDQKAILILFLLVNQGNVSPVKNAEISAFTAGTKSRFLKGPKADVIQKAAKFLQC